MKHSLLVGLLAAFVSSACSVTTGGALCIDGTGSTSGGAVIDAGGSGGSGGRVEQCISDSDCSDGDACTEESCALGVCAHLQTCSCPEDCDPMGAPEEAKIACNDGNPNTLDRCSAVDLCTLGGCTHAGVLCDWLDPAATQAAVCNDGDPCTVDYCEKDKFGPDLGLCRNDALSDCP